MNPYTKSSRDHSIEIAKLNISNLEKQLTDYQVQKEAGDTDPMLAGIIAATIRDLEWARKQLEAALTLPIQPDLFG